MKFSIVNSSIVKSKQRNGIAATIAAILALAFLSIASARADNIQTFDLFVTDSQLVSVSDCVDTCVGNYAPGSFSGTMTIDVTSGAVESVEVTVPAFGGPYGFPTFGPLSTGSSFLFDNGGNPAYPQVMGLEINPAVLSFVGFKGATIVGGSAYLDVVCSGHSFCGPTDPFTTDIHGTILAATPLPAPLSLFVVGLALMSLIGWRTSRRSKLAPGLPLHKAALL